MSQNRINKYLREPIKPEEMELLILEKELTLQQIIKDEAGHLPKFVQEDVRHDVLEKSVTACEARQDEPGFFEDGVFDAVIRKIAKKVVKIHERKLK